jgi:diguanylate cyclase (GGDEF)-like protein
MAQVVDKLAELTGFRDRDMLDATLVIALRDLLLTRQVAIYRCVGEAGAQRWLTRARLGLHELTPSADPIWVEMDALPPLAAYPERMQAMQGQAMVSLGGESAKAVFPLVTDREVVGVLEIESDQPLDPEAQRLVGSILRIFRNFQCLLDYSERDTLTGLLNRKTFDDAFFKVAAAANEAAAAPNERRTAGGSHFIGVIDIDHFKSVNDNFGHLIGDEVLLLLSRLMRSTFRFHDRLYRFGGEEFVVLMRCASDTDAAAAFERLRANVQGHAFPQVGHITVSTGFTPLKPGDTPSSAFERADKAVYWAKTHGRNQVCSHEELVRLGNLSDGAKVGDVELF